MKPSKKPRKQAHKHCWDNGHNHDSDSSNGAVVFSKNQIGKIVWAEESCCYCGGKRKGSGK